MKTSDFDYLLPESAVAQEPAEPRDACRLAVLNRATGAVEHTVFSDLARHLSPGDCLVLNDSKVLSCRVPCLKRSGGARVEALLIKPLADRVGAWEALLKPARRVKPGAFLDAVQSPVPGEGFEVLAKTEAGTAHLRWTGARPLDPSVLERIGEPPLPPYIRRRGQEAGARIALDRERYQTVYARQFGSAAAPTAGMHFTLPLLERLRQSGVEIATVTLHVGMGTFLPVKEDDPARHLMHQEDYHVSPQASQAVQRARGRNKRVVAVGTTSMRVLESAAAGDGSLQTGFGSTRLFILPGYRFKVVDALITNFHVPRSTLLMLVSAFDQRERVLRLYRECLDLNYRFLSYGDAMLLI